MTEPQASVSHPSRDEFAALLEESLTGTALQEGSVVKGTIVAIEKDVAVIDVGLKTEGRIPLKSSAFPAGPPTFPSATRSMSISSVSRTRLAKPCCHGRRRGGRRAGPGSRRSTKPASGSRA
jgi:hypothetical protein